jgi:hypothetical protein
MFIVNRCVPCLPLPINWIRKPNPVRFGFFHSCSSQKRAEFKKKSEGKLELYDGAVVRNANGESTGGPDRPPRAGHEGDARM